jgi:NitT/TauT family transport system ATP-binding protein
MNIKFENIAKKYHLQKGAAVKNFNLEVSEREFFCLVGPSGCGKSTILKIVADLEQPTEGQIIKPENISMVFQSGALLPWLTVKENVEFPLKMRGWKKGKTSQAAEEYLEMVKLTSFIKKYPRELSGGQRQRVGIARSLAINPEVLLLDEPFSALDPVTTDELHQDLLKIWLEKNLTILMVSHSLEEAVLLSDRIGVMNEGKLLDVIEIKIARPRSEQSLEVIREIEKIKKILEN